MGNFRFYRRVHVFPGLSLNLSKSGPSLTMGMRGAHVTVGSRGVRRTVGIPGTGAYWTSMTGHHTGVHSAHVETPLSSAAQKLAHSVASGISTALMGLFLVFLWAVFFGGK
jgi:hypothetical protein